MSRDVVVDSDVPIAARDYGGSGPDVVLLHGASRNLLDWSSVAELLSPHYRLVAMDLRGHGRSGGDGWSFDAALSDVEALVDALGLRRPAIVGHSLGGMLAGMWAATRECAAAVNLDGHGLGTPDLYDGVDPALAACRTGMLKQAQVATLTDAVPDVELLVAAGAQVAAQWGVSPGLVEDSVRRSVGQDGRLRPTAQTTRALLAELDDLDLMTLWTKGQCPLLVVNATAPDPSMAGLPFTWAEEHMAAYRRGLSRALTEAAVATEHLTVLDLDADHGLILNRPRLVAVNIDYFLGRTIAGA